jgi:hypothetical protein
MDAILDSKVDYARKVSCDNNYLCFSSQKIIKCVISLNLKNTWEMNFSFKMIYSVYCLKYFLNLISLKKKCIQCVCSILLHISFPVKNWHPSVVAKAKDRTYCIGLPIIILAWYEDRDHRDRWRVWPVSRGCLILHDTWSCLSICYGSRLHGTRFCICHLEHDSIWKIVNLAISMMFYPLTIIIFTIVSTWYIPMNSK